jgi:hypothetical protein
MVSFVNYLGLNSTLFVEESPYNFFNSYNLLDLKKLESKQFEEMVEIEAEVMAEGSVDFDFDNKLQKDDITGNLD